VLKDSDSSLENWQMNWENVGFTSNAEVSFHLGDQEFTMEPVFPRTFPCPLSVVQGQPATRLL
jgi:hypothetical protein